MFQTKTIKRKNGGYLEVVQYSCHWAVRVYSGPITLPNGMIRNKNLTACHSGNNSNSSWRTKIITRYKDN